MKGLQKITIILSAVFLPFFLLAPLVNADVLYQKENFFVNSDYDKYSRNTLNATLRYVSEHAYFYVDDSYWNSLSSQQTGSLTNFISNLAQEFDNTIYSRETALWGSEPNPGVDNDPHITILIEALVQNNGGYFETGNGYKKKDVPDSNQREMIAVGADSLIMEFTKVFLAHEFQHLVSFNQKDLLHNISDDNWLNELRSEYSVSLAGYNDIYSNSNLERRARVFLDDPSDSLTEWLNKSSDYGVINMFGHYLAEQYGPEILSDTLKNSFVGIDSINKFIKGRGYQESFSDIFVNWMVAISLNNKSSGDKYGYSREELKNVRVNPQSRFYFYGGQNDYTSSISVKNWQPRWSEFVFDSIGDKSIKLDFNGEVSQNFIGSYIVYYDNAPADVGRIKLVNGKGTAYVLNSGKKIKSVVVAVTNGQKLSNFELTEQPRNISITASLVDSSLVKSSLLQDGSLIKRPNEPEVYVVWGKYKRYLNPDVIKLYGHLDSATAVELQSDIFDSYTTSNYVRFVDDKKVYTVWPDGTKHWLNISAQRFDESDRDWNSIFTINESEVNFYKLGPDVIK